MIHGGSQSAVFHSLFGGGTLVMHPEFDGHAVWQVIDRHKVNLIFITGDAMARPMIDALIAGKPETGEPVRPFVALRHREQRGPLLAALKETVPRPAAQPSAHRLDRLLRDRLRWSGHDHQGLRAHRRSAREDRRRHRRHRRRGQSRHPGLRPGGPSRPQRTHPARLLQGRGEDQGDFKTLNGVRYSIPGDYATVEEDGTVTMLGRGLGLDQQRRREDLSRRGRGRGQVASRRLRRPRRRRARRALGQPCRRGRGAASGTRPSLADIVDAARKEIAGYKVRAACGSSTRSKRSPAGKPDYKWATAHRPSRARPTTTTPTARTPDAHRSRERSSASSTPIFGFTPSEHVAAAISRAGGLGVLGCVRFNDPEELEATSPGWTRNTDGKPYGVDIVMPAKVPTEGAAVDLDKLIPAEHRAFVDRTLDELGVPPLSDDVEHATGVLGWLTRWHVRTSTSR